MRKQLGLSRRQLVLTLFLAMILVALAVLQGQPEITEPYDPRDTERTGLRALVLWLEEMDHRVTLDLPRRALPAEDGLLFVHPSTTAASDLFSSQEVHQIYRWVEAGGTLVLVGPRRDFSILGDRLGVYQSDATFGPLTNTRQAQPLLPDLPGTWNTFFAERILEFEDQVAVVPVLEQLDGAPVVAIQSVGAGTVWHLTEDFAFTNLNLRDERIASLLPAILRTVPPGARVLITTRHLSTYDPEVNAGEVGTLQDWLYSTPFGQATLLVIISLLAYLMLQGRRLGPPLAAPSAARPREAAEYVSALAGLQRRIRQPHVVADHYRQRLKLRVGRLAQTPVDLPDDEWLAQMRRSGALSPAALDEVAALLAGYAKINNRRDAEADLIELVQATDTLLASLPRANMQLVR